MDDRREDEPNAGSVESSPSVAPKVAAGRGEAAAADIEALLRRYRPVAPPASLRARIAATPEAPEAAAPAADRSAEPLQRGRAAQPLEVPLQLAHLPAQATGLGVKPSVAAEAASARLVGAPLATAPAREPLQLGGAAAQPVEVPLQPATGPMQATGLGVEPSLAAEAASARIVGAPPATAPARESLQRGGAAAQPVEVPLQPATVPAQATGHAWPWLAAAAALLLCVLGLRLGGDGLIAQTQAQLADGAGAATDRDRADAAALAGVAETLGGDDIAWRAAVVLVRQQQQQKRGDEASGDRQDVGSDMP